MLPASVQTGLLMAGGVNGPCNSGPPKVMPQTVYGEKEPAVTSVMLSGAEHQEENSTS